MIIIILTISKIIEILISKIIGGISTRLIINRINGKNHIIVKQN